jgi:hypothetical protein
VAYPPTPGASVTADLTFAGSYTPPAAGPSVTVNLVFGATGSGGGGGTPIALSIGMSVVLSLPQPTVVLQYDNRTQRYLEGASSTAYQVAAPSDAVAGTVYAAAGKRRLEAALPWAVGTRRSQTADARHEAAARAYSEAVAAWQKALPVMSEKQVPLASAQKVTVPTPVSVWEIAAHLEGTAQINALVAGHLRIQAAANWAIAQPQSLPVLMPAGASAFRVGAQATVAPWEVALREVPGVAPEVELPVVPGKTYALVFQCPTRAGEYPDAPGLPLIFGNSACPWILPTFDSQILPARVYMTIHTLVAYRLPDMAEVPLYDCTLAADLGSFAWQFTASGPESLFAQLAPTASANTAIPQQLQITLDGLTWVFLVESLKRDHRFGQRRVSLAGRSATALVGAPWRREVAFSRATAGNAQQLAAAALDLTGIGLDWGITDWLVPANAWSAVGTPLAAVQGIADAAGGYLQSHRSAATVQVRHPYPARPDGSSGGPWNWGTGNADIELAPDAVITSAIERRDGPDINAVYVSGTTQGVLALVKRAGTAGDKLASLQTDALITASQAAQQRGLAALGKAGPQYLISLELPVLTGAGQPGVIDVGKLVQINESTPWRGRVRSVTVNAAMPTARQTITLERHL